MAKAIRFWQQWGWLLSICGYLLLVGITIGTKDSAIAQSQKDIAEIQEQKLPERMATQEQATKETHDRLERMENVQGKIFDRINRIVDNR